MSDTEGKPEDDRPEPAVASPSKEDRRRFLEVVGIGGLGAGLAAVVGVPAIAVVAYPLTHETVSGGDEFLVIGDVKRFEGAGPVKVELFADKKDAWNRVTQVKIGSAWVLRDGEKLRAFSTVCPHLGCAIDFEATEFKCPCHRSAFTLTGEVQGGPSPRGMDELELKTEGGKVAIRYQRFKQGVSEKEVV